METKNLKITLEQAKELLTTTPQLTEVIYNTFPELKPKLKVLDRWEDIGEIGGYYVDDCSTISEILYENSFDNNKNIFATKKQAESALAYAQLTQLMKATGDCDNINWDDCNEKFIIHRYDNNLHVSSVINYYRHIAFNTREIRDEFLEKHQELLKKFFQI